MKKTDASSIEELAVNDAVSEPAVLIVSFRLMMINEMALTYHDFFFFVQNVTTL